MNSMNTRELKKKNLYTLNSLVNKKKVMQISNTIIITEMLVKLQLTRNIQKFLSTNLFIIQEDNLVIVIKSHNILQFDPIIQFLRMKLFKLRESYNETCREDYKNLKIQ